VTRTKERLGNDLQVGEPIVVNGMKYRVASIRVSGAYGPVSVEVRRFPAKRASHLLRANRIEWEPRVGVWRAYDGKVVPL
jgi:hypothetical protein